MTGRLAALVIVSTTLSGVVLLADIGGPLQAVVILSFFLGAPGLAAVGFFEPLRADTRIALALGISIVTTVVVSQVLLYTDNWTPELGYSIVALISLAALSVQVVEVLAARLGTGSAQRLGAGRNSRPDDAVHHRPENLHAGGPSEAEPSTVESGQSSS